MQTKKFNSVEYEDYQGPEYPGATNNQANNSITVKKPLISLNTISQKTEEDYYLQTANNQTFPQYITNSIKYQYCWDSKTSSWLRLLKYWNNNQSQMYDNCGWQIVGLDIANDKNIGNSDQIITFQYRILFYKNQSSAKDIIEKFTNQEFNCPESNTKICVQKIISNANDKGLIGLSDLHPYAIFDVRISTFNSKIIDYTINKNYAQKSIYPDSSGQLFEQVKININLNYNNNFLQLLTTDIIQKDLIKAKSINNVLIHDNEVYQINETECKPGAKDSHYYGNTINDYCQNYVDFSNDYLKFGDVIKTRILFIHKPKFTNTQIYNNCDKLEMQFKLMVQQIWPNTYQYYIIYISEYDYNIFYGKESPCQIKDIHEIYTNYAIYSNTESITTARMRSSKIQKKFYKPGLTLINSTIYIKEPIKNIIERNEFSFPFLLENVTNQNEFKNTNTIKSLTDLKKEIFFTIQTIDNYIQQGNGGKVVLLSKLTSNPCDKLHLYNKHIVHNELFSKQKLELINTLNNYQNSAELHECTEYLRKNNYNQSYQKIVKYSNLINQYKENLENNTLSNNQQDFSLFGPIIILIAIITTLIITLISCIFGYFYCKNKKQNHMRNNQNHNETEQLITSNTSSNLEIQDSRIILKSAEKFTS